MQQWRKMNGEDSGSSESVKNLGL